MADMREARTRMQALASSEIFTFDVKWNSFVTPESKSSRYQLFFSLLQEKYLEAPIHLFQRRLRRVMAYRNGNYTAFYVAEPFNPSALGAHATKDFQYYNTLRMWKGDDVAFPFVDSHDKTYSVRDGSDWEFTLKPRLRERLRSSKNIVLILSSITANSRALREEVDYGINDQGLPVIVIYPEYSTKESLLVNGSLKQEVKNLWDNLPVFRDSMDKVPTLHVPMNKELIKTSLQDSDFMVGSKKAPGIFRYNP